MVDTITVQDNGIQISLIQVGTQGLPGATGQAGIPGADGTTGADGTPGDTFLNKPIITPVLGSDYLPLVRDGSIYLALVSDVLAAQGINPPGSQFDFSDSANSLLFGVF